MRAKKILITAVLTVFLFLFFYYAALIERSYYLDNAGFKFAALISALAACGVASFVSLRVGVRALWFCALGYLLAVFDLSTSISLGLFKNVWFMPLLALLSASYSVWSTSPRFPWHRIPDIKSTRLSIAVLLLSAVLLIPLFSRYRHDLAYNQYTKENYILAAWLLGESTKLDIGFALELNRQEAAFKRSGMAEDMYDDMLGQMGYFYGAEKHLLEARLDIEDSDYEKIDYSLEAFLKQYGRNKKVEAFRAMVKRLQKSEYGRTQLDRLVDGQLFGGDTVISVVQLLRSMGVDVDKRTKDGYPPIDGTIVWARGIDEPYLIERPVDKLLLAGISPVRSSPLGPNALFAAVKEGASLRLMETLIKYGADLHAVNEYGMGLMHLGVFWCSKQQLERLMFIGVDHQVQDAFGATPVHYAAIALALTASDMPEDLLEGEGIRHQDKLGETPLFTVARFPDGLLAQEQIEIIKKWQRFIYFGQGKTSSSYIGLLLDGPNGVIYIKNEHGQIIGTKYNSGIRENKAALGVQDKTGRLPVHYAFSWLYTPSPDLLQKRVAQLFEHGADKTVKNKQGLYPVDVLRASLEKVPDRDRPKYDAVLKMLE